MPRGGKQRKGEEKGAHFDLTGADRLRPYETRETLALLHPFHPQLERSGKDMVTVGFFVRLEAKPRKEAEVEARLKAALAGVEQEPGTSVWLALRLGPTSFAVVDAFPGERDRQAHLEVGGRGSWIEHRSCSSSRPQS